MRVFIDCPRLTPPDPTTAVLVPWITGVLAKLKAKHPRAVVSTILDLASGYVGPLPRILSDLGLCSVVYPLNHDLGADALRIAAIRATVEFDAEQVILFHGNDGDALHSAIASVGRTWAVWRPTPPSQPEPPPPANDAATPAEPVPA
ncbi:MAG: hypothetical protein AB7P02_12920 [Alphaproteobacteria bacterium]